MNIKMNEWMNEWINKYFTKNAEEVKIYMEL